MEFTLLFAAAIAFVAVSLALRWEAARGNAVDCAADLGDIALSAALVGLIVGRLASMISSGVNPITSPSDMIIIRGGVATGPAALAALAVVALRGRKEVLAVADALAVASLSGLAGWHGACLIRDACLGSPSDLPWAVSREGSAITRHPVEIYAFILYAVVAVVLAVARKRRLPPGLPAAIALIVAGGVRLITEPLRPSLGGGPRGWYAAAIVLGVAALFAIRRRERAVAP